ncbi:MAG: ATP-binding protein [Zhongshania sp.]|uniref:ATP-binding protein n=1 Tax=Zhongshania sp. TaxID=1971902 RepID=UPI002632CD50|nr:ATP-binding protein [Zhongshania sp.]MDF1692025.1 ATP-binding protein [Zhongshania sp.]
MSLAKPSTNMPSTRPGSITRRLIVASLTLMPLLLGLTGVAIDRAHTSSLISAEQEQLRLQFFGLLGAIEWQDGNFEMGDRLKEPRFWQFRSGLYAEIRERNGAVVWRSVSSDTLNLPSPKDMPRSGRELFGDTKINNKPFFTFHYHAIWETEEDSEVPLLFSLYSQQSTFLTERKNFRAQLSLWLSLVLILSLFISAFILYWGLRPLRELARDLRRLEHGETLKLSTNYPRELRGITDNLNQLLDKEKKQRERYRNTLADLAHSLKTPLAVLKSGSTDANALQEQITRMDNIINYQLKRAVSSGKQHLARKTPIKALIARLSQSLEKVYRDKAPQFQNQLPSKLALAIDEQDAMELFGNLLDNASKACRHKIRITATENQHSCHIHIDDDGPGMTEEQRQQLLQRGLRGDQYGQGHGLGLAIVRDIVDSYDGEIHFSDSPLGGLQVTLALPIR